MKKYPIGFSTNFDKKTEDEKAATVAQELKEPKKSLVKVYFPHRDMGWAYYNDQFDLKVGDIVFVEGKLEGYPGRVTEVNYSFKIKLSEYKKVIAVADTNVKGEFCLAESHLVSFDKNTIPKEKVSTWFIPPVDEDEFIVCDDNSKIIPLDDLSKMNISHDEHDRGYAYYLESKVSYIEVDGTCGYAIVEGSKPYEIEFNYEEGAITNIRCSCFCGGACRHEFAAMLQLRETLAIISDNYQDENGGYFAIISRDVFNRKVINKKVSGKIKVEV